MDKKEFNVGDRIIVDKLCDDFNSETKKRYLQEGIIEGLAFGNAEKELIRVTFEGDLKSVLIFAKYISIYNEKENIENVYEIY